MPTNSELQEYLKAVETQQKKALIIGGAIWLFGVAIGLTLSGLAIAALAKFVFGG
jgi:hypothetical protein